MRVLRLLPIAAALSLGVLPATAGVSTNPPSAPKGKYILDTNHASVTFCIKHQGVSNYCGRFNKASGTLNFNGAQPEKSSAQIAVDIASLDTPSDKLDDELRSTFFENGQFPSADFKTTSIKVTGDNIGEIAGDLTLHGVTKSVVFKTTFNGGQPHLISGKYVLGFSAEATLRHADFGFPAVVWRMFIGEDVALTVNAEFVFDR